jgi:CubicO group peptidase (beta-lactamase class C family)
MLKKSEGAPAPFRKKTGFTGATAIISGAATIAITALFMATPAYHVIAWENTPDKHGAASEMIEQIMSEDDIPGAAVVVVQEDETTLAEGFGITSIEYPCLVDENTVFILASVSKSFTALGVLLLRDEGLLDINKPVVYYLPDFSLADKKASSKITVRQLLTHTSGIPGALAEPQGYFNGPDAMTKMVHDISGLSLSNPPGSVFEYSNLNYFLLGAVVEAVTGELFENYMAEAVFKPLGLHHTTLSLEQAEIWGMAHGHQPVFGQIWERSMPVFRSAAPAGWVMSNASDMGRWLRLFLNKGELDGERLVRSETIAEMITPASSYHKDGHIVGYGMGWLIDKDSNGITRIWHGGDTPSFLADMMLLPDYSTGVAVMLNSQTSTQGHLIAPRMAEIFLDIELEQLTSPWWAHWKAIDAFSFPVFIVCLLLAIGLLLFVRHLVNKIRCRHYVLFKPHTRARWLPRRLLLLYNLPLTGYCLLIASGYIIFKLIYGYNIFTVVASILLVAPPSIWIAAMTMMALVALWSLTLSTATVVLRCNYKPPRK